jgi:hypothetical protein
MQARFARPAQSASSKDPKSSLRWTDKDLEVCSWPITKPIPYARSSRKIPERAIDKVASSIKEFGWRVPINF